ncbi:MAG: peptidoglycan editing factor PgeF [Candidatus Omnitrophica bacterium]|nr:peptidoglycan editing factor PgeF [Candidatus Omnitrophota bacterium]
MLKTLATQPGVYTLDIFGPEVTAAFSGREFSNLRRHEFLHSAGVDGSDFVTLQQIHSANLVLIDSDMKGEKLFQADGMLTQIPGKVLGVLTADCVPVFFWDPEKKVAAIVHAGWRGTYHEIATKMAQALRQNFACRTTSIQVALGPSIRKCCYHVGSEFGEMFTGFYYPSEDKIATDGKAHGNMDLIGAITDQLVGEGIPVANIHDTEICTVCDNDRFFSYRKEGGTEDRILSIIQIKDSRRI